MVVLLLLGILGASALPKFFEASRFQAMGYSDAVAGAMRYAQKIALASRCDVRVHVDAAGYALSRRARLTADSPAPECPSGGFTVDIPRPGGQSWAGIAPSGPDARRTGTSGKASRSREEIELVFDKNKEGGQDTVVSEQQEAESGSMQALWLRRVQTKPAEFLRRKFAFQHRKAKEEGR